MNRAICIVYWPGKDTPACATHLVKLQGLASAMGFPLRTSALFEPDVEIPCANCENEAKKAAEAHTP